MTGPPRSGPGSSDPSDGYTNPYAYSEPAYGGASYDPAYSSTMMSPTSTGQLPAYWTQTNPQPPTGGTTPDGPPPEPPGGPRPWLWALAGFAVAAVIGLIAWLVFVVASPSKDTSVAAPSSLTPTTRAPSRTSTPTMPPGLRPLPTGLPSIPPIPGPPTNSSGETESVTYDVAGDGIALTISYNDTGGMMQNEFGVELPWHKEVELPKPGRQSASIIVTNAGKDVTCSISVNGRKVVERKGSLLTVCAPTG
jgi:hypothetical protein